MSGFRNDTGRSADRERTGKSSKWVLFMLVRERMISPGKWISANLPVASVIEKFENSSPSMWLPVVDQEGTLLGLLTWNDVQKARKVLSESENAEGSGLLVSNFMSTRFLVVNENTPIEEAVRIMIDYNQSELPVVKDGYFTGIITDKIMLRVLMEITGARRQGVRLMVQLENKNGELLQLLELIRDQKGTIQGLCTYCAMEDEYLIATMRVENVDKYSLKQALKGYDNFVVLDIR